MIDAVPNIRNLANLKGEQISNVGSQDMSVKMLA
jgi:L-asparaginase/Glu-tRNA(Gln) amidotransferase subunit D